ncbi:MAG: cytochrome c [Candidatus Wallbacteria bacterium]|nr:cytochrome c [Candidatus Wallbacteria bacterium]
MFRGDARAGALAMVALTTAVFGLAGCVQKMAVQPRYRPLAASELFADGKSARPLVAGTVARGQLRTDEHLYTGRVAGKLADALPFPADRKLLLRGRERYNIYCAPCHDRAGTGDGMVVQRGYRRPPSFHVERLRSATPIGHFFDVTTNGFGAMPDYATQIPVRDRWAISAYIRALQLSQNAKLEDAPGPERARLEDVKPR